MTCHHNSGSAQMIFLKTLHNGSSQEVHENYIVFFPKKILSGQMSHFGPKSDASL